MTVLPWPANPRRPKSNRRMIIDPLPRQILHSLVADLPGPRHETETERAARFEAQLAEVLRYHPRNAAEAMCATHCVMVRQLMKTTRDDAGRPALSAAVTKRLVKEDKQFAKLLADVERSLARQQTRPLGRTDPALAAPLGIEQFLIPDPDDPDALDEAVSATIVPLHPAPKLVQ